MPRTPRTALRTLTTTATTLVLMVMTALPALAASAGTKPDAETNPYLIGTLEQLGTTAIVGIVVAIIAFAMLPKKSTVAEDEHH